MWHFFYSKFAKLELPGLYFLKALSLVGLAIVFGAYATSTVPWIKSELDLIHADTLFVVDSTADTSDFAAGDGVCDTNDGAGDGPCTLRAAIEEANALAGADTINFNIGGGGQQLIVKGSDYPAITEALIIDGTTQPGGVDCVDLDLLIEIQGAAGNTFIVDSAGVEIRGLVLSQDTTGLSLTTNSTGTIIQCNIIGLNFAGSAAGSMTTGISIASSENHVIGGSGSGEGNAITGTVAGSGAGISITSGTTITIAGNRIGTNKSGTSSITTLSGVSLSSSSGITVGGTTGVTPGGSCTGACNVIRGNTSGVIFAATTNSFVQGNHIGVSTDGTLDIAGTYGINLTTTSTTNTIGGASGGAGDPNARNVISGHATAGIRLFFPDNNDILGNYIGTNSAGTSAIPNIYGIYGSPCAGGVPCGHSEYEIRYNLISGNTTGGIFFESGDTNNTIDSNVIGMNAALSAPVANGFGVRFGNSNTANGNFFTNNTVAGNTGNGIEFQNGNNNTFQFNEIYSNGGAGVSFTFIGSGNLFEENEIFSNSIGVNLVPPVGALNNNFLRNNIYNNTNLGIDINPSGVNLNDALDADAGINNRQNFPVITAAEITTPGTTTEIDYSFDSTAADFTIDFYYSTTADVSGYGEGEVYFCTDIIAHPGGGSANYSESCATEVPPGTYITGVATRGTGPGVGNYFSSSEFSQAVQVVWLATDGTVDVSASTAVEASMTIQVADIDLNVNGGVAETVAVTLNNDNTGETENVVLTETTVNSGIFTSTMPTAYLETAGTNNNGVLSGASGHVYSVDYTDEYDSTGNTVVRSDTGVFTNGLVIAAQDTRTLPSGTTGTISVLANDYDPEGALNPATLQILANPAHGSAVANTAAGTVRYTSYAGFVGTDVFSYNICDVPGDCDSASVIMTVTQLATSADPTLTPTPEVTLVPTIVPTISSTPRPAATVKPSITTLPVTGDDGVGISSAAIAQILFSFLITIPALLTAAIGFYAHSGITLYAISWFRRLPKVAPWGIIYDETTMTPLAFATVQLFQNSALVQERISDLQGKFGFVNDQGKYTIMVKHPDYVTASREVDLASKEGVIARDIGLTPNKGENKNEFKVNLRAYFSKINNTLFAAGLVLTSLAVLTSPNVYNYIVFAVYLLQLVITVAIKLYRKYSRNWGYVYNAADNSRIKGAFVRVFDKTDHNQLEVLMTDSSGRFGFILAPEEYLLSASAGGFVVPSRTVPHEFFAAPTGELYTRVHVGKNQAINLAIAADPLSATPPSNTTLPSPFA